MTLPSTAYWLDRVSFEARLHLAWEQAKRYRRGFALARIEMESISPDIDACADQQFHDEVGWRLVACLRASDCVARSEEGGYFAILGDLERDGDLDRIVARIAARLDEPFALDTQVVRPSHAMGIAPLTRRLASPEDWVRAAALALRVAKGSSAERCHVFRPVDDCETDELI